MHIAVNKVVAVSSNGKLPVGNNPLARPTGTCLKSDPMSKHLFSQS